jgi:hypothetical protein
MRHAEASGSARDTCKNGSAEKRQRMRGMRPGAGAGTSVRSPHRELELSQL